jgi:hypothetical protein
MKAVNYNTLNSRQKKKVREEYQKAQNNKCFYCFEPLDKEPPKEITSLKIDLSLFPPNFLGNKVHLQHSHKTGMTEGAVHAYCNAVLWQYENR